MSYDLSGLHIVVSRNPLNLSRSDTTVHLQRRGAIVEERVSALTSFVLTTAAEAGKTTPTSKVAEARKRFIPVLTDADWSNITTRSALIRELSNRGFTGAGTPSAQPLSCTASAPAPPSAPVISYAEITSPFTTCL